MKRLKIGLHGATGRMGQTLQTLIGQRDDLVLSAYAPDSNDKHAAFFEHLNTPGAIDVVIDFSFAEVAPYLAEACANQKVALVSGTTGLTEAEFKKLKASSEKTAILWAPNMSRGVNLSRFLVEKAAAMLGTDWDAEITETHHRYKKDAPSGTALFLGEAIAAARGQDFATVAKLSREGRESERKPGEIGFSTIRGGDVVGEHQVSFFAEGERIEIAHRINHRNSFALGALQCAQWIQDKQPGCYVYQDMLEEQLHQTRD